MPTKAQTAANKRLRAAVANHIKVHTAAVKKAAKGSVPAGRLRKKRRRKAGGTNPYKKGSILYAFEKMMPGGKKAGWKNRTGPDVEVRKAQTAYQNKKNRLKNKSAAFRRAQKDAYGAVWQ